MYSNVAHAGADSSKVVNVQLFDEFTLTIPITYEFNEQDV